MAEEATPTTSTEEVTTPAPETEGAATEGADTAETDGAEAVPEATDQAESDGESETPDDGESDEPADNTPVDQKEAARRGYADRQRLRSEVGQALNEVQELPTAEQYIEQGIDPALAEVEVLKADIQREKVVNYLTELNAGLNQDAALIMRDFPIFNEQSPDYDEKFTQEIEDLYRQASGFRTDPSGRYVVNATMPLYDFYTAVMNIRGSGASQGVAKGQKAAEKMLAAAESPSSNQGKDPEMDAFEKGLRGK